MKFLTLLLTLIFSYHSMGTPWSPADLQELLNKYNSITAHKKLTKAPLIYEAVKNSDYSQYSREMNWLLDGPVEDFITAISYVDERGDSIIHQIIKTKKYQEEFSRELEALLLLMSGYMPFSTPELGGKWINIPKMEETAIGQAILLKDREKLKTALNDLLGGSARDLVRHLYAGIYTKKSRMVIEHIDKNYLSPSQTPELYGNPSARLLPNSLKLSRLLQLAKSKSGENPYALSALRTMVNEKNLFTKDDYKTVSISFVSIASLLAIAKIVAALSFGIDTTVTENFFDDKRFRSIAVENIAQIVVFPLFVSATMINCHSLFKSNKKRTLVKVNK